MDLSPPTDSATVEGCLRLLREHRFDDAERALQSLLGAPGAEDRRAVQACIDVVTWRVKVARQRPFDDGLAEAMAGVLNLQQHDPGLSLGWISGTIGYVLGLLGDFETGLDWLDRSVTDARQRDDRMQWVLALSHQATLLAFAEEHEQALKLFEEAVRLCTGEAAPIRAGLVSNLAYCQILRARRCAPEDPERRRLVGEALALADEALSDRESHRRQHWYPNALENRGIALGMLGRGSEAEVAFDEGLRQPNLSDRTRARLTMSWAEVLILSGRWVEARDMLQSIPAAGPSDLVDQTWDQVMGFQIEVARHFGNGDEAQALWERRYRLLSVRYRDRLRNVRRFADLRAELNRTQASARSLQDSNSRLERLATTDALTGLINRRGFEDVFEPVLAQHGRDGEPLSLMLMDIDHFKSINDRLGHEVGDDVLVTVARRLTSHVRSSDIVARWGGEEFIALMPGCDLRNAAAVAEKLRQAVAGEAFGVVDKVTSSFGVAQWVPGESMRSWFRRADSALYEAKGDGRNAVRLAT